MTQFKRMNEQYKHLQQEWQSKLDALKTDDNTNTQNLTAIFVVSNQPENT